jgi:GT2 family glycosyltransferase
VSTGRAHTETGLRSRYEALRKRVFEERFKGGSNGNGSSRPEAPWQGARIGLASVVVVVRNGETYIDRCLGALLAQDHDPVEVIVVDDGSTDRTAEIAGGYVGSGRVMVAEGPARGISAARNAGLRVARGEVVAYMDVDGFAHPGWLRAALSPLERDPSVGAVASLVFFDRAPMVINAAGATLDVRGNARDHCFCRPLEVARLPHEVLYPMGCGMVFRRQVLEDIGGFDEEIARDYDEVDAAIRVWRSGRRIVLAPDAWVDHVHGQSAAGSTAHLLHQKGRIRVMLAHLPARAMPRWLAGELPWLLIPTEVRDVLRGAWGWNLRRLGSVASTRLRWRHGHVVPRRLLLHGRAKFEPAPASPRDDLLYGWHDPAGGPEPGARWTTERAGMLLHAERPLAGIRIEYRLPPRSPGATIELRRPGELEPLLELRLEPGGWRTAEAPLALDPGHYEAVLKAPWTYQDRQRRKLGVAVARLEPIGT